MRRKTHVLLAVSGFVGLAALVAIFYAHSHLAELRAQIRSVDERDAVAWGERLFRARGCGGCHTVDDPDRPAVIGPNLSAIGARADAGYIRRAILVPDFELADDCGSRPCRAGMMPAYDTALEPAQVDALVAFLLTRGSGDTQETP